MRHAFTNIPTQILLSLIKWYFKILAHESKHACLEVGFLLACFFKRACLCFMGMMLYFSKLYHDLSECCTLSAVNSSALVFWMWNNLVAASILVICCWVCPITWSFFASTRKIDDPRNVFGDSLWWPGFESIDLRPCNCIRNPTADWILPYRQSLGGPVRSTCHN